MFVFWLYFFFFKQKTAYGVRISDWSSDVCSSDLRRPRVLGGGLAGQHEDAGADHRADAQHDQLGAGEGALERGFAFKAALERLAGVDVARRLDRLGGDKLLEHPIPQLIDGPRSTPGCMPPGGRGEWRATLPHT